LPRVGGALSARSRQYQGTAVSMSNAAKVGSVARAKSRLIGRQSGDPAKLARALITIASQEPPPRRFIAGADAIAGPPGRARRSSRPARASPRPPLSRWGIARRALRHPSECRRRCRRNAFASNTVSVSPSFRMRLRFSHQVRSPLSWFACCAPGLGVRRRHLCNTASSVDADRCRFAPDNSHILRPGRFVRAARRRSNGVGYWAHVQPMGCRSQWWPAVRAKPARYGMCLYRGPAPILSAGDCGRLTRLCSRGTALVSTRVPPKTQNGSEIRV
jgi:hypothetical protein